MGELWRSEKMQLVQLFIPLDAAHDTVDELGELGLVQFKDLNANVNLFQRNFVNEVKKADEMDRKIRFFADQVKKEYNITDTDDLASVVVDSLHLSEETSDDVENLDMEELESHFDDLEKELLQMNSNQEKLRRNFNELIELEHVLTKDNEFFAQADRDESSSNVVVVDGRDNDDDTPLLQDEEAGGGSKFPKAIRLGFVTGVINRDKLVAFERILWRATRGNLFLKQSEIDDAIEDPNEPGKLIEKNVFIIFFQGARAQTKIKKICESFAAHLYPCPDSPQERKELLNKVDTRLEDLDHVIQKSADHRRRVLQNIATHYEQWKLKVLKEKSIYHTMNMFNYDIGRRCLIAEGWCPVMATNDVQDSLKRANKRSGSSVPSILNVVPSKEEPPTYFKTNRFTQSFQDIVSSYGIARYQEVNPAPFTIITFPFLFGVMFGDAGHGFLLLLFSGYLVWKEKYLASIKLNEMVKTCFDGRYVLLLMSVASIYCGFLYNEIFGVPMDIFGSRWARNGDDPQYRWTHPSIAYPFGVDPAWKYRKNELIYYNSLKMKISIIFGVFQMSVGIFLSLLNGLHFRKPLNIIFEFIPQISFMMSIFGYMCFLIFLKWCTDFGSDVHSAPQLLNMMIDMFLKCYQDPNPSLYSGQKYVQWVCIFIAVVSVPTMLFPKPYILKYQWKKRMAAKAINEHHEEHHAESDEEQDESKSLIEGSTSTAAPAKSSGGHGHGDDGDEFDFGEIFVHQVIHTIEFVLGCVSNTASYLRLWALSLAHSELAYVFWSDLLVGIGLKKGNFAIIFASWAVWAVITFGVLLIMESLSAFLHALRLHWVEFQNKFYQGDGYEFQPFSYVRIIAAENEDNQ